MNILHRQHLAFCHALGRIARNQQMLFHRFAALSFARFALQNAQNAVGVAHGRNFGVGGDDCFIGKIQRHQRARFNASGRIAHHKFKVQIGHQFFQHFAYALFGERVFIAGLRSGQNKQVFAMLVFNQGLDGGGLALNHIHQVIHHTPLAAHNQIQIAQAHVKVNHAGFVSLQR